MIIEKAVFRELMHLNLINSARRFHEYFKIETPDDFEALKEAIERVTMNQLPITEWPAITEWKDSHYEDFTIND